MDGGTILVASAAIYTTVSGVTIYATKKIISTAVKGLSQRIDREREDRLRVEGELQNSVNSHGHKGLDGNDARVTK